MKIDLDQAYTLIASLETKELAVLKEKLTLALALVVVEIETRPSYEPKKPHLILVRTQIKDKEQ